MKKNSYISRCSWPLTARGCYLLLLCYVLLPLVSCNTTDDDEYSEAVVVDLGLSDSLIKIGEKSVLSIEFSFSANSVLQDGERVVIAAKLAPELSYETGTAEIKGMFGDNKVSPEITLCKESGETILLFELDGKDLSTASNPDGDADARLNLIVKAKKAGAAVPIEVKAANNTLLAGCGVDFNPDRAVSITIL